MRAWIVRCVVVVGCLIGCGSVFAGTKQCSKALHHIREATQRGDLLAAKLLADQAVADACLIGCNDRQQVILGQLREEVYRAYVTEQLNAATKDITVRRDGYAALQRITNAVKASKDLGAELEGIDSLSALAFVGAAVQNLRAAEDVEKAGAFELSDRLRSQAIDFFRWASALDERVKKKLAPPQQIRASM